MMDTMMMMLMLMRKMMMNVKDEEVVFEAQVSCFVELLKVMGGENNLTDVTFKSFVIGELYIFIILQKN